MDEQEVSNDNERLKEEAESLSGKWQSISNTGKWQGAQLMKAVISQFSLIMYNKRSKNLTTLLMFVSLSMSRIHILL